MNNLSFDEMTLLIFGEEKLQTMKAEAAMKAKAATQKWKKEIEEIMQEFDSNNDIMTREEEKPMKHTVLLDSKQYEKKPAAFEAGAIQKRLPECRADVTIEELAAALSSGRTFKPNYMTGRNQDSFVSSSLIAIDIDNKGKELEEHGYISLEDFQNQVSESDLKPAIIYTTFSHTKECHKYRAIFQLNRKVTNLNELKAIGQAIKAEYPYADAKVSVAHLIYGGNELIAVNPDAVIAPIVKYEEEVEHSKSKTTNIKNYFTDKKTLTEEELIKNLSVLKPQFKGKTIDIVNSFDWINNNVPMTTALGYDTSSVFRCILPNHRDEKPSARISETADGRQNYICSCQNTYLSLIDVIAKVLNKNKVLVQYMIADAIGVTIGSEYQRKMRLLTVDLMTNTENIIETGSVLDKFMTRSNLHGLYNLIQQFALKHITVMPLGAKDQITFFMSQTQIKDMMQKFNIKGSGMIGYKLNTLKELGLIRALKDEEINPKALAKAKQIRNTMSLNSNGSKYLKRVEYYELCLITPEEVEEAERIITLQKEFGVKRKSNNATRRAAALGEDFAESVNVQMDILSKINNPKLQKQIEKALTAAETLIEEQGYFTEEQLRKQFDPKRKMKKDAAQKIINDAIPTIILNLNIQKDRVKKVTRKQFNISAKIKSNTVIYF